MAESAAVRRPADGCESSCPGCILRGNMATGILPGQPIGSLHLGPQTTNVAEGFHSGLNSRFGMSHPSLRLFLGWLQKYQFEMQCRGLQLVAGRHLKQRPSVYIKLDNNLWAAKLSYSIKYGYIFRDFALSVPAGLAFLRMATEQYLSRVTQSWTWVTFSWPNPIQSTKKLSCWPTPNPIHSRQSCDITFLTILCSQ